MNLFAGIFTLLAFIGGKAYAFEVYERDLANENLKPILLALKNGIRTRDVSAFEEYVLFPLNISSEKKYVAADGTVKLRTKKIYNAHELQAQFDEVFTTPVMSLIECITPENMTYDKYKGFNAAYGGIWFFDVVFEDSRKRIFALASVSKNKMTTEKWMNLNCGETPNKLIQQSSRNRNS